MPDPFEYLKAVLAAIVASTTILLAFRVLSWKRGRVMSETANVVAMTCGVLAGYFTLNFSWPWPPANALDRFLTIVLPAILIIELVAATLSDCLPADATASPANNHRRVHRAVRGILWIARCILSCGIGRILMHGSIYLEASNSSTRDAWLIQNMPGILLISTLLLMAIWFALTRLAARSASSCIVLSVSLSILCAGCTTMMAGYIKGGAAALPLASVLMVSALVSKLLISKRIHGDEHISRCALGKAAIGIGLVSLFSLVWIGRFFGQLTSADAVVMFLTPLLCWITELPLIRNRSAVMKFTICLVAVIVPLAVLLLNAKREFDEKMAPLL
jgi:hypothetical protein